MDIIKKLNIYFEKEDCPARKELEALYDKQCEIIDAINVMNGFMVGPYVAYDVLTQAKKKNEHLLSLEDNEAYEQLLVENEGLRVELKKAKPGLDSSTPVHNEMNKYRDEINKLSARAKYADKLVEWAAKQVCADSSAMRIGYGANCGECVPCRARMEINQELEKAR